MAEAQFRVGSATKAKVFRAEAEVAAREADIVRAGAGLLDAKEVLKRMAGIDKDFDIKGRPRIRDSRGRDFPYAMGLS